MRLMRRNGAAVGSTYLLMLGAVYVAAACSGSSRDFADETAGSGGSASGSATAGSATAGSASTPAAGRTGVEQGGDGNEPGTGGSPDSAGAPGGEGGSPDVPAGGAAGSAGSGGGSSGSGGSGGNAPACPATHQCVAQAPAGWTGPVIYAPTSALPTCPSSYPATSLSGGTGVTGSTTCQCSCTAAPQSSSCAAVTRTTYLDSVCATTNGGGSLSANACLSPSGAGMSQRLTLAAPVAQCGTGTHAALAAPSFSNPVLACGGATEDPGTCGSASQVCLPKPPTAANASTCVYKSGVDDCPAGYTTSAQLVYKSWTDSRSCPASCSCTGSGGVCSASRQKFSVGGCSVAAGGPGALTSTEAASCLGSDAFTAMQIGAPSVTTAPVCSGGSQAASGALSGAGAVTVCCR